MRSKLMTAAMVVAGVVLAAQLAAADQVQEQLRLMEQRMAEMEDRLEAQASELESAQETVSEQQAMLSDAGLVEEDDRGVRSGISAFLEAVDISGVAAASYNYRFYNQGDNDGTGGNPPNGGAVNELFRHPNGDSFQIDQIWFSIDKAPTEESRGGFHADLVWGETASAQGGSADSGLLYTGYVSYLAPLGDGVQFDAGKLATPLGAEVIKTNENFNVTQGALFGLQPVAHVGVQASTEIADGVGFTFGVVNEVYDDTNVSADRDKAYYGQVSFGGDNWGLNVGAIAGEDATQPRCDATESDCNTSVFDVVLSASPTDNIDAWINFDWRRFFGSDVKDADAWGIAAASRVGITDQTGVAARVEYVTEESTATTVASNDDRELFTLTGTVDHEFVEGLVLRGEVRWDREIEDDYRFSSGSDDQVVGLAEIYYEF